LKGNDTQAQLERKENTGRLLETLPGSFEKARANRES
jgi:hypothetical protein